MRAAADGVIDYSKHDPYDPICVKREALLFLELERREHVEILKFVRDHLDMERLRMFIGRIDGSPLRVNDNKLQLNQYNYLNLMLPWVDHGPAPVGTLDEAIDDKLWEQWRRRFGDPDSPEVQARIRERIEKNMKPGRGIVMREIK